MTIHTIRGLLSLAALAVASVMLNSCGGGGGGDGPQTVPEVVAQLVQQGYLKASNTGPGDRFGSSVALDGNTLAVGASAEDSVATGVNGNEADDSATDSGAVYVFTRNPATGAWSQQAYIKASNTETGLFPSDGFGVSVALASDTLAVGAPFENSNATGVNGNQTNNLAINSGAVYVFTRDPGTGVWSQQAYIKASNTEDSDFFGQSVALSGDTLAVGANGEDSAVTGVIPGSPAEGPTGNGAVASGAVYVFTRTAGAWTQQAYIKASNTGALDEFGTSVALNGDTLAVGAIGEDSNANGVNGDESDNTRSFAGAVYVFTRSSGAWTQQAYVKSFDSEMNDNFGRSAALDGDTLAVGAPGERRSGTGVNAPPGMATAPFSGAVFVFTRSGGTWTQQAYVKASNTDAGDEFGWSVALGADTLAVGARFEHSASTGINGNEGDNSAQRSGAVYLFTRAAPGVWSQQAYIKASNTESFDAFGWSVGVSGDSVAVAANEEDGAATGVTSGSPDEPQTGNGATNSGAAYVFQPQ